MPELTPDEVKHMKWVADTISDCVLAARKKLYQMQDRVRFHAGVAMEPDGIRVTWWSEVPCFAYAMLVAGPHTAAPDALFRSVTYLGRTVPGESRDWRISGTELFPGRTYTVGLWCLPEKDVASFDRLELTPMTFTVTMPVDEEAFAAVDRIMNRKPEHPVLTQVRAEFVKQEAYLKADQAIMDLAKASGLSPEQQEELVERVSQIVATRRAMEA